MKYCFVILNRSNMHRLKKYGLVLKAAIFALVIVGLKTILHFFGLEIIEVGPVITALVAGVFFVLAIILSGVMSDFKESEKIPGELSASIEALYKDSRLISKKEGVSTILNHIHELTHAIISNFQRKGTWKLTEINGSIDEVDRDIRVFAENGAPTALIVKLRVELGNIKKISNRVEVVKETSFLPPAQAIAEFATGAAIIVLLLLKTEPYYEGFLLIGAISLILLSVVLLIRDMDNPFEGHASIDMRQLYKLDKYLESK
jgi:hypothetical protein